MNYTNMVLGFAFDDKMQNVCLIIKQKPEWQKNKLNGIGGKTEMSEHSFDAMIREFREETGVSTQDIHWNKFAILKGLNWRVDCFYLRDSEIYENVKTVESEVIIKINVYDLWNYDTIFNLRWLIPYAIEHEFSEFKNDTIEILYKD